MRVLIIGIALVVLVGAPAASQTASPGPAQSPGGRPANRGLTGGELASMLDSYALVQAQETLQLDDERYGQFVVRLRKLQEIRRRNQQARSQIVQDLRTLANRDVAQPDENAIRERLRALREHDERASADVRRAFDALDELLSVTQQARLRVFEENIERRKLDLLVRARERAARIQQRRGGS